MSESNVFGSDAGQEFTARGKETYDLGWGAWSSSRSVSCAGSGPELVPYPWSSVEVEGKVDGTVVEGLVVEDIKVEDTEVELAEVEGISWPWCSSAATLPAVHRATSKKMAGKHLCIVFVVRDSFKRTAMT